MGELFEKKVLSDKELQTGIGRFFGALEDVAIDLPSAPKILCSFLVHGTKDKYLDWEYVVKGTKEHVEDKDKFVATLLHTFVTEHGDEDALKAWKESGVSLLQLGISDEAAFVQQHNLEKLFPSAEMSKLVQQLLDSGTSGEETISQIEKKAGELGCLIDRDMSRMIVGCIIRKVVDDLGGAEELIKSDGEKLIEPKEKEALKKHQDLLKKWLEKECDQALALFEVQKVALEINWPKGHNRTSIPHACP